MFKTTLLKVFIKLDKSYENLDNNDIDIDISKLKLELFIEGVISSWLHMSFRFVYVIIFTNEYDI